MPAANRPINKTWKRSSANKFMALTRIGTQLIIINNKQGKTFVKLDLPLKFYQNEYNSAQPKVSVTRVQLTRQPAGKKIIPTKITAVSHIRRILPEIASQNFVATRNEHSNTQMTT